MMRRGLMLVSPVLALLLGACGGTEECNDPRLYQQAVSGKRVDAPEGLDSLTEGRELTIPSASPQAPLPPGDCLDAPPTLSTEKSRK